MIKGKILIVESDEDVRAAVAEYLRRKLRVTVLEAAVVDVKAIDLLHDAPDVIVTNLMPDEPIGCALYNAAEELGCKARFVVLTGDPYGPDRFGKVRVFRKPHELGRMADHVRTLLPRVA